MELPGRHWTDKALHEMGVRDWRIFREDFEIQARASAQGGKPPDPMRNDWRECGLLPDFVLEAVARF